MTPPCIHVQCTGLGKGVTQEHSIILRKQESKFSYIQKLSNEYHYLLLIPLVLVK